MSTTQDTPTPRQQLIADLRLLADELELTSETLLPTPLLNWGDTVNLNRHLSDVTDFIGFALASDRTRESRHPDGTVYLIATRTVGRHVLVNGQITLAEIRSVRARGVDVWPLSQMFPAVAALASTDTAKAA